MPFSQANAMNTPATQSTTTACPYKALTGNNLPIDAKTLWEEFARLSRPTFVEFAAVTKAARDAVCDAAIRADRDRDLLIRR